MRNVFAEVAEDLAEQHSELVVIVGDISHGLFRKFAARFPARYYNIGILEPSMAGIASGMSKVGLNPIVHTIAPFLIERSFEQLKLDFGYQRMSANFVSVGNSFDYSQLGVSHHSYSDVSLVSQVEGSSIFLPGSSEEFRTLFESNFSRPGLKYFRLSEQEHNLQVDQDLIRSGSGVLVQEGTDLTIVTTGPTLKACVKVLDTIEAEVSADLIYMPTLKPADGNQVVASLSKTGKLLTVDNLHVNGGMQSIIQPSLRKVTRPFNSLHLGVEAYLHQYGTVEDLLELAGLSAEALAPKILNFVRDHD